jgi:protein-disulfide isomerase
VRHSAYAFPLGIPTPTFGIIYFTAVLAAAALPRARRFLLPLSLAGAAGALGFLSLQAFAIHAFCKLCMTADTSAILLAGVALALHRRPAPTGAAHSGVLAALALAAGFLPLALASEAPGQAATAQPIVETAATLPEVIAREQRHGVVTVVEFMDFECPFCRKLHDDLAPVLASYGDRVRLVRKMVPLKQHEHALPAALAYCCADDVGKGDAMAEALIVSKDLSPTGCEKTAEALGIDLDQFKTCVRDERTMDRVQADAAEAKAAGVRALPTLWIGHTMHRGLTDASVLRASIDEALAHPSGS